MSIRSICSRRSAGLPALGSLLAVCASLCAGCWYSGGEALFLLGFGRGQKIDAKFRLTRGPVLILIDDPQGRVDWPPALSALSDQLGEQLVQHGAAARVVPRQTLDQVRQTETEFERRGCREIGELCGAEQVLWVQAQDFVAEEQFFDPSNAAYFVATVKVINVAEKTSRSRVRLWPESPEGQLVQATLNGNQVAIAKTKGAIAGELATQLARRIARLFYDHRATDFGKDE